MKILKDSSQQVNEDNSGGDRITSLINLASSLMQNQSLRNNGRSSIQTPNTKPQTIEDSQINGASPDEVFGTSESFEDEAYIDEVDFSGIPESY